MYCPVSRLIKYSTCVALFIILLASCQQKNLKKNDEKLKFPFNVEKLTEGHPLDQLRSVVKNVIQKRQASVTTDLFDMTYYHIQPEYFSNLSNIDATLDFDGFWLKFENDYSYAYGIYDKLIGNGTYHYSSSEQLLIMLDSDIAIEPKIFTVLSNSEFMNFMGRPLIAFYNQQGEPSILLNNWNNDTFISGLGRKIAEAFNGIQIKMILLESRPSQ